MSQILIVEDNIADGEILTKRLQHIGCNVTHVVTGEAAKDMLSAQHYELIVVDLVLPGIDGWTLLDWIRHQPETKDVKTVSITAYYDPQVAHRAKSAGFLHCFPKPATQSLVEDLQKVIRHSI